MLEVFLLSIPNSLTSSDLRMWICPLEQTKKKEERKNVRNVFLHWALMISKAEVLILSYHSLNKVVPFRALYISTPS